VERMDGLSLKEERALLVIQSAFRCHEARAERRRLVEDREEEERWRKALARRRERIERLEREINIVEEMAPAAVDKYASTARYGRSNTDAAARTIQGLFRCVVRSKARAKAKTAQADAASRVLQRFFHKAAYRREETKIAGSPGKAKQVLEEKLHLRAVDDLAAELPSLQRVQELQARVNEHLAERRKKRGISRTSDDELADLAERGRRSMQVYKDGLVQSRLETLRRVQLREETSTLMSALWGCSDMPSLLADMHIQASASSGKILAMLPAPKEHVALLTQIAQMEHKALLAALRGGFAPIVDRTL